MSGSIRREGDYLVIRLPVREVHGLRVALQPCSCRAAKSKATAGIREKLDKGLAKALFTKPTTKAGQAIRRLRGILERGEQFKSSVFAVQPG